MQIWLFRIAPWRVWKYMMRRNWNERRVGVFRNLPHIVPGRWGFFILGFEFGSRNPGNKFGTWLKRVGLWPW